MKHETIRACSIWRALELVGDVPVLLIMEQLFLRTHRFDDFVRHTGLTRASVNGRLKKLMEASVVEKYTAPPSVRQFYRLTEKGLGLYPVALMILRWQHRWHRQDRGFTVTLTHWACGASVEPVPVCGQCGEEIDPRHVDWRAGPGLKEITPIYSRRRQSGLSTSSDRKGAMMVDPAIELFGDRWATLIVRACFTGIHRFDAIQRDTHMATNILTQRLERLLAQGIIRALPYSAGGDRHDYRLTAKGRDLYPVLMGLLQWGDRWYADVDGPPLLLSHKNCGHDLHMQVACSHCKVPLHPGDLVFSID